MGSKPAPTVRLAFSGYDDDRFGKAKGRYRDPLFAGYAERHAMTTDPTVRLALPTGGRAVIEKGLPVEAPTVRLAHGPGAQGDNVLLGQRGVAKLPDDSLPALLVSYFYIRPFMAKRERYGFRDWVLDSGAFSAANSGSVIDLQAYIEFAKEAIATDDKLSEVYALDVIGDWRATRKNVETMWAAGVPAIPTFHTEQPWSVLTGMARDYPKIALGGLVGMTSVPKLAWLSQCFARVWPARIHGFGVCFEKAVMTLPFHSVDATNWELGPCKFGNWKAFGAMSVRGSSQNLRAEVEWHLALERRARARWRVEMEKLEAARGPLPDLRTLANGAAAAAAARPPLTLGEHE